MKYDERHDLIEILEGDAWHVRARLKAYLEKVEVEELSAGSTGIAPGMELAKTVVRALSVKPPQNPGGQMLYDQKAPVLAEFQEAACRNIDQELAKATSA